MRLYTASAISDSGRHTYCQTISWSRKGLGLGFEVEAFRLEPQAVDLGTSGILIQLRLCKIDTLNGTPPLYEEKSLSRAALVRPRPRSEQTATYFGALPAETVPCSAAPRTNALKSTEWSRHVAALFGRALREKRMRRKGDGWT